MTNFAAVILSGSLWRRIAGGWSFRTRFVLALLGASLICRAGECTDPPGNYERAGYTINAIRLRGPLQQFRAIREQILKALPIKARQVDSNETVIEPGNFDTNAWSLGTMAIRDRLGTGSGVQRFEFVVVVAGLENCQADSKTLDATYRVFAFGVPAAVNFTNRPNPALIVRSLAGAGLQRVFRDFFPQPLLNYDKARGVSGGTEAVYQSTPGGLFDTVHMSAEGSGNSLQTGMELQGSRSSQTGTFRDSDWGLNYRYSDQPAALSPGGSAAEFAIREAVVSARFGSSTKPLVSAHNMVLRLGGSLEAGSTQTNATAASAGLLNSESRSALKIYAGALVQGGRYVGRWSYGLQRTQQGNSVANGFFKNVIDTRHQFSVLPRKHLPISVETDFGGGWLPKNKPIPASDAFFGGNTVRSFIPGDSWDLRSDPLLRSLPQFSLRPGGSAFGASRFIAWNSTIAPTVWGRPLIPQEVLDDPTLVSSINGQLKSAEEVLASDYIVKDPTYAPLRKAVGAFAPASADLRKKLNDLNSRLPQASQDKVTTALSDLDDVDDSVHSILQPLESGQSPTREIRALAKGFGAATPAQLALVAGDLRAIKPGAAASDQVWLESSAVEIDGLRADWSTRLDPIETRGVAAAHIELAFARRVVDRLLNEVNVVSVAPAFLLDVVRVGPEPVAPRGWRIGAGGGIRFSLVNVNLTLGYSFNVGRKPSEPRGAFFVQFQVADLFR